MDIFWKKDNHNRCNCNTWWIIIWWFMFFKQNMLWPCLCACLDCWGRPIAIVLSCADVCCVNRLAEWSYSTMHCSTFCLNRANVENLRIPMWRTTMTISYMHFWRCKINDWSQWVTPGVNRLNLSPSIVHCCDYFEQIALILHPVYVFIHTCMYSYILVHICIHTCTNVHMCIHTC
jgi:hypothetical protein